MTAWVGYVWDAPVVYQVPLVTGLSTAQPRPWSAHDVDDIQADHQDGPWPLMGMLTHLVKTPISHNRGAAFVAPTFSDDLFEHFLVVPSVLNLGNLLTNQTRTVEIANLYSTQKELTAAANGAGTGVTFQNLPPLPKQILPFDSVTVEVTVSSTGAPSISGSLSFTMADIGGANSLVLTIPVTGQRITLFPWDPEQFYTEQLEWKTDIIEAYDGSEQRISIRLHPRQVLTYEVFSTDPIKDTAMRLTVFNWLPRVWGVPIWWEQQPMTASLSPGGNVISVNTEYADYRVGGLVFIQNPDKEYETFEVEAITANSITTTSNAVNSYPVGSKVMPCRTAYAKTQTSANVYLPGQEKFQIQFTTLDNVGLSNISGFTMYKGLPVLDDVNYIQSTLQEGMSRSGVTVIDNFSGQIYQVASTDRSRPTTKKTWYTGSGSGIAPIAGVADLTGQQQIWVVRGFLHWAQGSQQVFWLPTNRNDMQILADIPSGSQAIEISAIGVSQYAVNSGGGMRPYGDLRITFSDGSTVCAQITGAVQSSSTQETINTDTVLAPAGTISKSTVVRVEFLQLVRIAGDKVKLTHDHPGRSTIEANLVGVLQ